MTAATPTLNPGDTAWMLTSSLLVLMMTLPGLALFYGGLVRAKNVLSVLMQCFAIVSVVTILWVAYGYSVAFMFCSRSAPASFNPAGTRELSLRASSSMALRSIICRSWVCLDAASDARGGGTIGTSRPAGSGIPDPRADYSTR